VVRKKVGLDTFYKCRGVKNYGSSSGVVFEISWHTTYSKHVVLVSAGVLLLREKRLTIVTCSIGRSL
jgi:hypothetical protein